MENESKWFATALLLTVPLVAGAQSIPESGALLCEMQYQHMMPAAKNDKHMIMETAGNCTIEKGGPIGAKVFYVVGLDFDEKGVGTLLYGGGNTTVDGKVIQIRQMLDAKYVLELKDGKVVGWKSSGRDVWLTGDGAGAEHTWAAVPTGETTLRIDYAVKK